VEGGPGMWFTSVKRMDIVPLGGDPVWRGTDFFCAEEIIFCVFRVENSFVKALIPLKGVLKKVPFIGVR